MNNTETTSFKLYVPFEFACICNFKKSKPILVYKSKAGDIFLSRRKTLGTLYGYVYFDDTSHITFTKEVQQALSLQKSDILAIHVRMQRLYLDTIAKQNIIM